jgi:cupin fold WbuC family metalloprotein
MEIVPVNNEVYYTDGLLVTVNNEDITSLKIKSHVNPRKRVRFCAHQDTESIVHEMIIIHERGIYVRPHKHIGKSESFHIIEGIADVVIFDNNGAITDVIEMGDFTSGRVFYYRLSKALYHSLLIRSEMLVFHEVTSGPFKRVDTQFAPWAPDDIGDERQKYLLKLDILTKSFLATKVGELGGNK